MKTIFLVIITSILFYLLAYNYFGIEILIAVIVGSIFGKIQYLLLCNWGQDHYDKIRW